MNWRLEPSDRRPPIEVSCDCHLGRLDTSDDLPKRNYISREQAAVIVTPTSLSIACKANAKNAMGLKRRGSTEWQKLTTGSTVELADGDTLALDWMARQHAGCTFVVRAPDAPLIPAPVPPEPAASSPEAPLTGVRTSAERDEARERPIDLDSLPDAPAAPPAPEPKRLKVDRLESPPAQAEAPPFAGMRVLVALPTVQRGIQEKAILRGGGEVVQGAAAATHMVLETRRDPASHPELRAMPPAQWPSLKTDLWVPNTAKRTPSESLDAHPAAPTPAAERPPVVLAAGRFGVGNAYLNLLFGEVPSPRHVSWADLKPAGCTAAFFTSLFPDGAYDWLRSNSADIADVLIVADRCPAPKPCLPPTLSERDRGWWLLEGQRNSGQLMHCSLMLFRTADLLRVAIGGTNLDGQIHIDRDALFVQDFRVRAGAVPADVPHFGGRLETFLEYMATVYPGETGKHDVPGLPAADLHVVRGKCAALLADVDFGAARDSALVTCMPGGTAGRDKDKGGWQQLRQALAEIGAPALGGDGRIEVATGHFGHIKRDFLAQMCRTLRRVRAADAAEDEWDDVGRTFLYHSSRRTVLSEGTNCLACFRTTAPGFDSDRHVLDTLFHDALPKFERIEPPPPPAMQGSPPSLQGVLSPILHGKAILATSADATKGVFVVGSQNFGKGSWGLGGNQPGSVEIAAVLQANSASEVEEMRARFPVQLAPDEAFGTRREARDPPYVIARGATDGVNDETGLQFRWRIRCNDLTWLEDSEEREEREGCRSFLRKFWRVNAEPQH